MTTVLDTCALLLLSDGSYDLPPGADDLALCAVTWSEIAWKHRIGKLPLADGYTTWQGRMDRLGLTAHAVDRELFLAAVALDWDHGDPADRLIVTLAQREQAVLLTCDPMIRAFYPKCGW